MIQPLMTADELLADYRDADNVEVALHAWWLGQSGFLLKWNGFGLLFDPYLSDAITRRYQHTATPRPRLTGIPIDPHQLDVVGVVTSSSNHPSHLDSQTLLPLTTANPGLQLVLSAENREAAARELGPAGPNIQVLNPGDSVSVGPWEFHGISSTRDDRQEGSPGLGLVVTFGEFAVFHSGSTLWHDHLVREVRRQGNINLAMLPINGNGSLNGLQSAALGKAISAAITVPCHYGMFADDPETADEFTAACHELDQRYQILQCGQRLTMGLLPGPGAG